MPLIKKVSNANPGNANLYGGNDLDTISDYFNDTDTTNVPRINNPTEFRNGILKIRDSTNTYNVSLKSAAQTADRDFTIPALTGNDSYALLGIPQSFLDIQTIIKDAAIIAKLYRPANTTNNLVGIGFDHRNSSNTQVEYGKIETKLVTNTAGSEDGMMVLSLMKAGVMTQVGTLDKNGLLTVTSLSTTPTGMVRTLVNSGATVTTASTSNEFDLINYSVVGNMLGANGVIRMTLSGYILQNQASATDFTLKIKFGTTTIYQETIGSSIAQHASNRPFILRMILGNANSTSSQTGSGLFNWQDTGGATTGEGDLSDDETQSAGNFRTTDPAKDTTSAQTLQVTMTMSVSDANVATSVRRKIIEFIPGA